MKWQPSQMLALVATVAGIYVVLMELPFLASRSSLAPALTALGIAVSALGISILISHRVDR